MLATAGASLGRWARRVDANDSDAALTVNQRGSGLLVDLQDGGTTVFSVGQLGAIVMGASGSLTLPNDGLHLLDTNASHDLIVSPGSNLTADRVLTITTGDAARTLTFTADASIGGTNTGDQTITLTGDVTGSGTGSFAATIADDAVTYAKMQDVSVTDRVLGRSTAGAGVVEEIPLTAAARSVLDDTTVAAMVDTLGGAASTGTGGLARATSPTFVTPALGTPASGVMTNVTGVPAAAILAGSFGAGAYVISTSLQVATIELGHATDTTLARSGAGVVTIEGYEIVTENSASVAFQQATTISTTTGALTIAASAGLTVGLAASSPAPDNSFMHVWAGSAGTITAFSNSVLVLERNGPLSLTLLIPATGDSNLLFGDPTNNRLHAIETYGSSHASRANMVDFIVGGVEQLRWTNGVFNFQVATAMDIKGGYLSLTERAAPGAGAADTARIYAIVGGDTLTDLAAVFQDGTVDIFAQEVTSSDDPVITLPHGVTPRGFQVKRPHPGVFQLTAEGVVIKELEFHDVEHIQWVRSARSAVSNELPAGWVVTTAQGRLEANKPVGVV